MSKQDTIQFPESLVKETLDILSKSENHKKGANEVTKSLTRTIRGDEKYNAVKLVIIADDVEPEEVTFHLAKQTRKANVPYVLVPSQDELGETIGIKRTAAVAVFDESAFSKVISNASEILGL